MIIFLSKHKIKINQKYLKNNGFIINLDKSTTKTNLVTTSNLEFYLQMMKIYIRKENYLYLLDINNLFLIFSDSKKVAWKYSTYGYRDQQNSYDYMKILFGVNLELTPSIIYLLNLKENYETFIKKINELFGTQFFRNIKQEDYQKYLNKIKNELNMTKIVNYIRQDKTLLTKDFDINFNDIKLEDINNTANNLEFLLKIKVKNSKYIT